MLKKQKKLSIPSKLQTVIEVKEAVEFLNPQLSEEQLKDKLLFLLSTIADSTLLKGLHLSVTRLANEKAEEVTDLYCNFFSDNNNDNN